MCVVCVVCCVCGCMCVCMCVCVLSTTRNHLGENAVCAIRDRHQAQLGRHNLACELMLLREFLRGGKAGRCLLNLLSFWGDVRNKSLVFEFMSQCAFKKFDIETPDTTGKLEFSPEIHDVSKRAGQNERRRRISSPSPRILHLCPPKLISLYAAELGR